MDQNNTYFLKMLKFDPITLADWKTRNIQTVSIEFIASGCEGTSIQIHENSILEKDIPYSTIDFIEIYTEPQYQEVLNTAYITHTRNKWILKSEGILTRCGCGKSFALTTGSIKLDKIQLLKSKLAKRKSIHH